MANWKQEFMDAFNPLGKVNRMNAEAKAKAKAKAAPKPYTGYDPSKITDPRLAAALAKPTTRRDR